MEPMAHTQFNRDLDRLGNEWEEYKAAVRHHDMEHGERGIGMEQRAEKIVGLVRHLAELAPRKAQSVAVDPQAPVGKVLVELRDAREAVLPRRRQHEPKHKFAINAESKKHISFMRNFAKHTLHGDHAGYIKTHFPKLCRAAEQCERMVKLYDLTVELEEKYSRATITGPLDPAARMEVYRELQRHSNAMLEQWPAVYPVDKTMFEHLNEDQRKRADQALVDVHFALKKLPNAAAPNRADLVSDVQKSVNELRYEACAAGHRAFAEISRAYRADRLAMAHPHNQKFDAQDPIAQQLPMLDLVYHARWALLNDAITDLVKSNRKTLERHGALAPQTNAEAAIERMEDRGTQGRLF